MDYGGSCAGKIKMEKKYCDVCEKEIGKEMLHLFSQTFMLWGKIYTGTISRDFCSKKCLIKFVETEL